MPCGLSRSDWLDFFIGWDCKQIVAAPVFIERQRLIWVCDCGCSARSARARQIVNFIQSSLIIWGVETSWSKDYYLCSRCQVSKSSLEAPASVLQMMFQCHFPELFHTMSLQDLVWLCEALTNFCEKGKSDSRPLFLCFISQQGLLFPASWHISLACEEVWVLGLGAWGGDRPLWIFGQQCTHTTQPWNLFCSAAR